MTKWISRASVLRIIDADPVYSDVFNEKTYMAEQINNLPVKEEARPHGEWIEKPSYTEDRELGIDKQVVCSRCDEQNSYYVYGKDGQIEGKRFIRSKFCPNCGSDNRKRGESE